MFGIFFPPRKCLVCRLWPLFLDAYFRPTFKETFLVSGNLVRTLVDHRRQLSKGQLSLNLVVPPVTSFQHRIMNLIQKPYVTRKGRVGGQGERGLPGP